MPPGPEEYSDRMHDAHVLGELTHRQAQVWRGIAVGMSDYAIAGWLSVSESTVRDHVQELKGALFDPYENLVRERPTIASLWWLHLECCALERRTIDR